jgi:hypothetical protein
MGGIPISRELTKNVIHLATAADDLDEPLRWQFYFGQDLQTLLLGLRR